MVGSQPLRRPKVYYRGVVELVLISGVLTALPTLGWWWIQPRFPELVNTGSGGATGILPLLASMLQHRSIVLSLAMSGFFLMLAFLLSITPAQRWLVSNAQVEAEPSLFNWFVGKIAQTAKSQKQGQKQAGAYMEDGDQDDLEQIAIPDIDVSPAEANEAAPPSQEDGQAPEQQQSQSSVPQQSGAPEQQTQPAQQQSQSSVPQQSDTPGQQTQPVQQQSQPSVPQQSGAPGQQTQPAQQDPSGSRAPTGQPQPGQSEPDQSEADQSQPGQMPSQLQQEEEILDEEDDSLESITDVADILSAFDEEKQIDPRLVALSEGLDDIEGRSLLAISRHVIRRLKEEKDRPPPTQPKPPSMAETDQHRLSAPMEATGI